MPSMEDLVKNQPPTAELKEQQDEIKPEDAEKIAGGAGGFYQQRGSGSIPGGESEPG